MELKRFAGRELTSTTTNTGWNVDAVGLTVSKRAARLERRERALAARPAQTPTTPAPGHLRVATWNINSIRSRRVALERFLARTEPDIVCLPETRAGDLPADVEEMLSRHGYRATYAGAGGHNGVAVIARHDISDIERPGGFGDEYLDREARLVSCTVHSTPFVRVASVYVPHGHAIDHWHYHYKLSFIDALASQTERWLSEGASVIVAGDMNVAPTDSDVFHPTRSWD